MKQNTSLPERLEDLLPAEARKVDKSARTLIDWLVNRGYQLTIPPLVESISSLLANDSEASDLAARTLRLTDPLGGLPIGIRADITPQIRRIDERTDENDIARICYCGPTIYARPTNPWLGREQLQAGAELFGASDISGDREIVMLAAGALEDCKLPDLTVALGHAGLISALLPDAQQADAAAARAALARRDCTKLAEIAPALVPLAKLHGEADILQLARTHVPQQACESSFRQLEQMAELLKAAGINCVIDLAGLAGYEYHNGLTFAVLSGEKIVARGGRYNRAERTATGFTADVRAFASLLDETEEHEVIAACPAWEDSAWHSAVAKIIGSGQRVQLRDVDEQLSAQCTSELVRIDDSWQVVPSK